MFKIALNFIAPNPGLITIDSSDSNNGLYSNNIFEVFDFFFHYGQSASAEPPVTMQMDRITVVKLQVRSGILIYVLHDGR